MDDGYEEIVNQADPKVRELAHRAKVLITRIMPDVVEVAWPKQNIISYGVGLKKMSELFA